MKLFWLPFILFISFPASAEFSLNNGLTAPNRELILKTLGLGTLSKNLSQPEPLKEGLELAISTEMINVQKIKSLMADAQNDDVLYYPKISIGKGIYERWDFFFHFIPFTSTLGVSEFGGVLRYNFYQAESTPLFVSALLHANSANFNNQLTTNNIGSDLYFGLGFKYISVTTGLGWGKSRGSFIGGVTDSALKESEDVQSTHFSVGTQLRASIYTMALSLDHYSEAVYSLKLGVLF